MDLSEEYEEFCPRCGTWMDVEICEDKQMAYLTCASEDCGYETKRKYKLLKFYFTYKYEFTTQVEARNYDEARQRAQNANWQPIGLDLLDDCLDVEYCPVFKAKKE